jgi:hypothetical protein
VQLGVDLTLPADASSVGAAPFKADNRCGDRTPALDRSLTLVKSMIKGAAPAGIAQVHGGQCVDRWSGLP